jgi:hypothetical protein
MAIYVYVTQTGALYSYIPDPLTVAQAQANGQLADDGTLQANGRWRVDQQPPLDETHAWDPATLKVVVVTPLKSKPSELIFWQRFTSTEREAIEGLAQTGTQGQKNAVAAFYRYVAAEGGFVDCNDSYVQQKVTQLEQIGILAAGRAAQILV